MYTPNVATVFVTLCTVMTALSAQTVYRCGNTYSQTPCPAATTVDVEDPRTAAQKVQADEVIRREKKTARSMEADRLMQERKNLAQRHPITVDARNPSNPSNPSSHSAPVTTTLTPKRLKAQHTKPKDFVAEIPGTRPPPSPALPTHPKIVKPGTDLP